MFLYILKTYSFIVAFAPLFIGAVLIEIISYKLPLFLSNPKFCGTSLSRWEELYREKTPRAILALIFTLVFFYFFSEKIPFGYYLVFAIVSYFLTVDFLKIRYWLLGHGWWSDTGLMARFFFLIIIFLIFAPIVRNTGHGIIFLLPFVFMFGTGATRHFIFHN